MDYQYYEVVPKELHINGGESGLEGFCSIRYLQLTVDILYIVYDKQVVPLHNLYKIQLFRVLACVKSHFALNCGCDIHIIALNCGCVKSRMVTVFQVFQRKIFREKPSKPGS